MIGLFFQASALRLGFTAGVRLSWGEGANPEKSPRSVTALVAWLRRAVAAVVMYIPLGEPAATGD